MANSLLQLFARPPQSGKVKTRLIPDVGVQAATAIYRHCLQHNLKLLDMSPCDSQLWLSTAAELDLITADRFFIQQGQDLGQRMYHALSTQLESQRYDKAILIGADCLDLTPAIIQAVERKLDDFDLVLIPAEDGGYVLIAVREQVDPALFRHIDWGSNRVLHQTLQIAEAQGIKFRLMNPLRDIDRLEDLQHYPQLQQYL